MNGRYEQLVYDSAYKGKFSFEKCRGFMKFLIHINNISKKGIAGTRSKAKELDKYYEKL